VSLLSTRGVKGRDGYPFPPPMSGNALVYTTVIETPTVCYETRSYGKNESPAFLSLQLEHLIRKVEKNVSMYA
jgi:hypothetical protein